MSNYITTLTGTRIEGKALTVRPNENTIKIVTRMLDGSHSVQQIGSAANKLQVTFSVADKTTMNSICSTCEPIKIYHFQKVYTGIISSQDIAWSPLIPSDARYQGTFEVVVTGVDDR